MRITGFLRSIRHSRFGAMLTRPGAARLLVVVPAAVVVLALLFLVVLRPLWPRLGIVRPGPTAASATGAAPTDGREQPRSGSANRTNPAPSGQAMPTGDLPGWRQVFADDFTGDSLSNKWVAYEGQPLNDPAGWFSPSHVSVGGSVLTIGAWRERARNDIYVTGGVSNREVLSQTYGRYDVRFRMDRGHGIAYAILLWPASDRYPPEIDFAEDNGRDRDMMHASVHAANGRTPIDHDIGGDFGEWHTAGVRWESKRLEFTLDGKVWVTVTGSEVPAQPMALAIQSQAWYCGHTWEACPDVSTPGRVDLQVDWAVAYTKQG